MTQECLLTRGEMKNTNLSRSGSVRHHFNHAWRERAVHSLYRVLREWTLTPNPWFFIKLIVTLRTPRPAPPSRYLRMALLYTIKSLPFSVRIFHAPVATLLLWINPAALCFWPPRRAEFISSCEWCTRFLTPNQPNVFLCNITTEYTATYSSRLKRLQMHSFMFRLHSPPHSRISCHASLMLCSTYFSAFNTVFVRCCVLPPCVNQK